MLAWAIQGIEARLALHGFASDGRYDAQYFRFDTKKAVDELAAQGVTTYRLTLDPEADDSVSRTFGRNRYTVVDHVQKLPERLPALIMGLTK